MVTIEGSMLESVAIILERSTQGIIQDWLRRVRLNGELMASPLTDEMRGSHLHQVFRDLVYRLCSSEHERAERRRSSAAAQYGVHRSRQRYSALMIVEESRMLEVSIVHMLHINRENLDSNVIPIGVMAIAHEVDSQLGQATASFIAHSTRA